MSVEGDSKKPSESQVGEARDELLVRKKKSTRSKSLYRSIFIMMYGQVE